MSYCSIRFIVGQPVEEGAGRWIEAEVLMDEPDCFAFGADLCEQTADQEFSMYRISAGIDAPFTAKAAYALLKLIGAPPFEPSTSVCKIYVEGDQSMAKGEVAKLVDPGLRTVSQQHALPANKIFSVLDQISQARKLLKSREEILTLGASHI